MVLVLDLLFVFEDDGKTGNECRHVNLRARTKMPAAIRFCYWARIGDFDTDTAR